MCMALKTWISPGTHQRVWRWPDIFYTAARNRGFTPTRSTLETIRRRRSLACRKDKLITSPSRPTIQWVLRAPFPVMFPILLRACSNCLENWISIPWACSFQSLRAIGMKFRPPRTCSRGRPLARPTWRLQTPGPNLRIPRQDNSQPDFTGWSFTENRVSFPPNSSNRRTSAPDFASA